MSFDPEEIVDYERPDTALRDGIGEEDNAIPLWFNVGFYGLIVVGVIYAAYYTLSGWSAVGEYEVQVAVADARAADVRAALPTQNPFRGDAAAISEGKQVFDTICAACHKVDGSGLVGPSLVDPYWKYGDADSDLYQTVSEGRPLGMPPWGPLLGAEKIWKSLAYIETLPRSDKPGVGAPDFKPETAAAPGG